MPSAAIRARRNSRHDAIMKHKLVKKKAATKITSIVRGFIARHPTAPEPKITWRERAEICGECTAWGNPRVYYLIDIPEALEVGLRVDNHGCYTRSKRIMDKCKAMKIRRGRNKSPYPTRSMRHQHLSTPEAVKEQAYAADPAFMMKRCWKCRVLLEKYRD